MKLEKIKSFVNRLRDREYVKSCNREKSASRDFQKKKQLWRWSVKTMEKREKQRSTSQLVIGANLNDAI